jgi:hypothetical protein
MLSTNFVILSQSEESSFAKEEKDLASLYKYCLDNYRLMLAKFSGSDDTAVARLLEEYARLERWGAQRRALLPASVPGALAEVLRHEPDLAQTVSQIFKQLIQLIEFGT